MVKRNLSRNSEPRNSLPDALCHSEQSHRNIYLDNDGALWQGMIIKCPGRIAAPSRGTWRNERGAMTIQDALDEITAKLNDADETHDWQKAIGDLIIATDQLKSVVEAVIRYNHIDAQGLDI